LCASTEEQQFLGGNGEASSLLQLWVQTYGLPVKAKQQCLSTISSVKRDSVGTAQKHTLKGTPNEPL